MFFSKVYWAAGAALLIMVSGSGGLYGQSPTSKPVVPRGINFPPNVTTSGGATVALEQVPVEVDPGIILSFSGYDTLQQAKIFLPFGSTSEDELSFTNSGTGMGNITSSYAGGMLVMISTGGSATLEEWQSALRSVTYTNNSDSPNTADRLVSFTVMGGPDSTESAPATKAVRITAVNDAPELTVPASLLALVDESTTISGISGSDPDSGNESMFMTLEVDSGSLTAVDDEGVTVNGSGGTELHLVGSMDDINAFIASGAITYTPSVEHPETITLLVNLHDNGNTGEGGNLSDEAEVVINVTVQSSADDWTLYR